MRDEPVFPMTIMTMFRLFCMDAGSLWDQPDDRHDRHVPWSQRCEHDDRSELDELDDPIWIGDAIAEWLLELSEGRQ